MRDAGRVCLVEFNRARDSSRYGRHWEGLETAVIASCACGTKVTKVSIPAFKAWRHEADACLVIRRTALPCSARDTPSSAHAPELHQPSTEQAICAHSAACSLSLHAAKKQHLPVKSPCLAADFFIAHSECCTPALELDRPPSVEHRHHEVRICPAAQPNPNANANANGSPPPC